MLVLYLHMLLIAITCLYIHPFTVDIIPAFIRDHESIPHGLSKPIVPSRVKVCQVHGPTESEPT